MMKLFTLKTDKFKGTRTYRSKINLYLDRYLFTTSNVDVVAMFDESDNKVLWTSLVFFFTTSSWMFLNYRPITFLADGIRIFWDQENVDHSGDVCSDYLTEMLFAPLDVEKIKKLGFSNVVEGQIGNTEFSISYDDRACLRELSEFLENINNSPLSNIENIVITEPASLNLIADELKKLAELRDLGVLTTEEFDQQKQKLLSKN